MNRRLRAGLARVVSPAGASTAPAADRIAVLVLETTRVRGVLQTAGRDGWVRTAAADWPVDPPAETPLPTEAGAATEIVPAGPAADSLVTALTAARAAFGTDTVAVGLPTSMLLVRILRLPTLAADELAGAVSLQMDKLSPFSGDDPTVGWEILSSDETLTTVFAAAVPGRCLAPLEGALTAAGLHVSRTDATLLDVWRILRDQGVLGDYAERQAVLIAQGDEWDLLLLDAGLPVLARGLGRVIEDQDLARELALSLSQAEIEVGLRPLQDVLVVSAEPPAAGALQALRDVSFEHVRAVTPPAEVAAVDGLALRTRESVSFDLTPPAWRNREQAAFSRRRLLLGLGVAAGVWLALVGLLVLGPLVMEQLTLRQKRHEAAMLADYRHVYDVRERVQLIRRYMDRSHSLLEALRTITSLQPDGIELNSLTYRREDGCKLAGETAVPALVYAFVDQLRTNAPFADCKPGGVSAIPGTTKHRFELDALFAGREDVP